MGNAIETDGRIERRTQKLNNIQEVPFQIRRWLFAVKSELTAPYMLQFPKYNVSLKCLHFSPKSI